MNNETDVQKLRNYLKANPNVKPKVAIIEMANQGVKITSSMVYYHKDRLAGKARKIYRNKPQKKVNDPVYVRTSYDGSEDNVEMVKELLVKMAKETIDLLAKL